MILTLAYRNLLHDRVALAVTLTGIVFSVVLVAVQLGLYLGSERTIANIVDHSRADLWIVPFGAKSVDDSPLLSGRERYVALSVPGVATATDLAIGFAKWERMDGSSTASVLVGADPRSGGLEPWNLVEGDVRSLAVPAGIAVDRAYFQRLGVDGVGGTGQISQLEAKVVAVTDGIRSFTTLPYVFTTLDRARAYLGARPDQATFVLVSLAPGAAAQGVKNAIAAELPDTEVLTRAEFRDRSLKHWLFGTGAGAALIAGALLGLIVGTVIVAQTLYASTKDHLKEFATLRALGAGASYIHRVILAQALLSAGIGYLLGIAVALLIVRQAEGTALRIVMTPGLAGGLLALTVGMCVLSALAAIVKVTRIDPAMVVKR